MKYPIPQEAFDDRLAIFGTAGAGKTYLTIGAMARLLKRGSRLIGVDPLGVMYGLRLEQDGKTPSEFKPVIFGGPHGDLPLNEQAGALIGETAATMQESCILDLSDLGTKASERRFMLAFLTALYKHANREPVHLIFDESDMWAPQKLLDKDGDAARLLGMMETVVRRGRVRGFVPWLISQRPAVLAKDVLSQADGVVALKLTSKQDRDAFDGWIEGAGDRQDGKAILARLPTYARGEGVVWIPARGVLEKDAVFPANSTFDSSRTPKRGEKKVSATLKPIDIDKLKTRLGKVVEEQKANDPVALKAEISRLRKALAAPVKDVSRETKPDPKALDAARRAGFAEAIDTLAPALDAFEASLRPIWTAVATIQPQMKQLKAKVMKASAGKAPAPLGGSMAEARSVVKAAFDLGRVSEPVKPASAPPQARRSASNIAPDGYIPSKVERHILSALILAGGEAAMKKVAVSGGYAIGGGGFANGLGRLRTLGLIEKGQPLRITEAGRAAIPEPDPLPTGKALLDFWFAHPKIGKAERTILQAAFDAYPHAITKEDAAGTGDPPYEPNGGGFANALGRLRALELISKRGDILIAEEFAP